MRGGKRIDVFRSHDESVEPRDLRPLANLKAAVADRGDEVHEADQRALAREKKGLPIRIVLRHGRGSGGEVGD